jgi:hypothetical protein
MTWRFILILMILSLSDEAYSQFDYYVPKTEKIVTVKKQVSHIKGDKTISLSSNFIDMATPGLKMAGGLKFQIFLSERISIDADLAVGKNYFHGGPGIIALPFWLISSTESGFVIEDTDGITMMLVVLAASMLSFEHISYHLPLKNNWELSPYISLLRYRQYTPIDQTSNDTDQLTFATGIQMDKYYGRLFISPYFEFNVGYSDGRPGINTGIGIGISFP